MKGDILAGYSVARVAMERKELDKQSCITLFSSG
jgi:hypothetical protein